MIENERRKKEIDRPYRPETGEGSITGKRFCFHLPDAPIPIQYIPEMMLEEVGRARKTFTSAWFDRKIYSERVERIPFTRY